MNYSIIISLILLLPLCGFVVLGLFGKKYFSKSSGVIGSLLLLTCTLLALYTAYNYFIVEGPINGTYPTLTVFHITWLSFSNNLSIDMGILMDPISVMMLVVVTFISFMVHLFSIGYMKGEERLATYFSFLSLFTFSMLGLIISSNLFQIYIFWELVGVSSFLLIGFYFEKPAAVAASKKAFVVTRFADLGFLIGILLLGYYGDSFEFITLIRQLTDTQSLQFTAITTASFAGVSILTWSLILIFMGGAGKSAMFPLHIWLPDAMEGPTPVSALIHAATMVVAGVFLVARLFPLFSIAETALNIVTFIGLISAFLAAVIACTQTDIKRVLAYSTMSQIGFMMFAIGSSNVGIENSLGYTASLFHLFTHAFFKSLLFLAAGAIIHIMHSNEMKDMGGLRKYMPITHLTFLIACLAISGIPPFAGFFSKEEILLAAYHSNKIVFFIALFTSGLTAFYMFRLYFSIFWNKQKELHHFHHEGTWTMKLPLVLLATCSVLVGFIPFGKYISFNNKVATSHFDPIFSIAPVTIAVAGILIALWIYKNESNKAKQLAVSFGSIYRAAYHKFYVDELYLFITKKIIFNLVGRPAAWIDKNIVDGMMNGIANSTQNISFLTRKVQSGKIQHYLLYFFAGIISMLVVFIYLWK